MSDIPGQRLSVNRNGLLLTQSTVEETVEQINNVLKELKDTDNRLFKQLRGELVTEFSDTMQFIEENIKSTGNMLQITSQEMHWYGNQFIQIDSIAGQHAGGTVK